MLWDIDGTLVDSAGHGRYAFDDAFEAVPAGRSTRRVEMAGRTDHQIAMEMLGEGADGEHLPRLLEELAAALERRKELIREEGRAYPGAPEALEALAGREGVAQSLLTGNVEAQRGAEGRRRRPRPLARLRARRLRLRPPREPLRPGGRRARAGTGQARRRPVEPVLVGDTPLDVRAAHDGGSAGGGGGHRLQQRGSATSRRPRCRPRGFARHRARTRRDPLAQPALISATPASASATPASCGRATRSPSTTRASTDGDHGIERGQHRRHADQPLLRRGGEEAVCRDVERADGEQRRDVRAADRERGPHNRHRDHQAGHARGAARQRAPRRCRPRCPRRGPRRRTRSPPRPPARARPRWPPARGRRARGARATPARRRRSPATMPTPCAALGRSPVASPTTTGITAPVPAIGATTAIAPIARPR